MPGRWVFETADNRDVEVLGYPLWTRWEPFPDTMIFSHALYAIILYRDIIGEYPLLRIRNRITGEAYEDFTRVIVYSGFTQELS
jgi:hypothetical protein